MHTESIRVTAIPLICSVRPVAPFLTGEVVLVSAMSTHTLLTGHRRRCPSSKLNHLARARRADSMVESGLPSICVAPPADRSRGIDQLQSAESCSAPTGSSVWAGITAQRVAMVETSSNCCCSEWARTASSGLVGLAAARELFITHAQGRMLARSRSAVRARASVTGVVSGRVTTTILVEFRFNV